MTWPQARCTIYAAYPYMKEVKMEEEKSLMSSDCAINSAHLLLQTYYVYTPV
jgi:hypothetical protein